MIRNSIGTSTKTTDEHRDQHIKNIHNTTTFVRITSRKKFTKIHGRKKLLEKISLLNWKIARRHNFTRFIGYDKLCCYSAPRFYNNSITTRYKGAFENLFALDALVYTWQKDNMWIRINRSPRKCQHKFLIWPRFSFKFVFFLPHLKGFVCLTRKTWRNYWSKGSLGRSFRKLDSNRPRFGSHDDELRFLLRRRKSSLSWIRRTSFLFSKTGKEIVPFF